MSAGEHDATSRGDDAEDVARHALRQSLDESHLELALSCVIREQSKLLGALLVENQEILTAALTEAMKAGIQAAASDEELATKFFSTAFATLRSQSKKAAGNFVWDRMTVTGKNLFKYFIVLTVVWWYLGADVMRELVVHVWQAFTRAPK